MNRGQRTIVSDQPTDVRKSRSLNPILCPLTSCFLRVCTLIVGVCQTMRYLHLPLFDIPGRCV